MRTIVSLSVALILLTSASAQDETKRKRLSNEEFIERQFAKDDDRDGRLSAKELGERGKQLLKRGDSNRDGFLDKDEIKKLACSRKFDVGRANETNGKNRPDDVSSMTSMLVTIIDVDKSGDLSAQEIKNATSAIQKLDQDRNGTISKRELAVFSSNSNAAGANSSGNMNPTINNWRNLPDVSDGRLNATLPANINVQRYFPYTTSSFTVTERNGTVTINGSNRADKVVIRKGGTPPFISYIVDDFNTANPADFGPYASVTNFTANLGDGNDSLSVISPGGFDSLLTVYGGKGSDNISGTDKADSLFGGPGADYIRGLGGNDTIYGGWEYKFLNWPAYVPAPNTHTALGDYIDGGAGNDVLTGDVGDDIIIGGPGTDQIEGISGNDTIIP